MELPFSPACERNKEPIAQALAQVFDSPGIVLELASGTGQHGEHMALSLPHITWQCSDLAGPQAGLAGRIRAASLPNLPLPLVLDVCGGPWPAINPMGVFAANVLHIAGWACAAPLFAGCGSLLPPGAPLVIYGPFNDNGFTSDGNASLDAWARESFPGGGLRELSDVTQLADRHGFGTPQIQPMPANNLLLIWTRQ